MYVLIWCWSHWPTHVNVVVSNGHTTITSVLRQDDVATSFRRNNDVIIASCVHWVTDALAPPCCHNYHIDGIVQNCSISIVSALEILPSCTKSPLWHMLHIGFQPFANVYSKELQKSATLVSVLLLSLAGLFPHHGTVYPGHATTGHANYRQTSDIRRTKSQHLNVSRLVLQLSLPSPLKPGVKSRMKM